ncbi:MAG: endonuclease/exonuclease/phosphatase family protein, partial [Candidatus Thiodiazotropha taylori]|nr:endonuclease/exonuclease/phosphatase family protein [Candidatus Thiodiazotropha taylori]MCW4308795.1 endonuclease/exonuclease/phosphatase family protein [Candidatus Thiodiazotropha endolucinida]
MLNHYKSDGLGGVYGVSCSLHLGTRKKITRNKFHFLLFFTLVSCIYKPEVSSFSNFSLILALQRSNEMYKTLRMIHPCTCKLALNYGNIHFTHNLIRFIFVFDLALWVAILLILSGDVEVNPGPGSVDSNTDSNHNVSASSLEMLSNHLSIFHLNIQSIVPKMDLIRSEADAYDILIFTESWLKPDIPDTTVYIENFSEPFRNDRRDRLGGGVLAYVRETITCKRRYDLEINGLEAIWLELLVKSKKLLIAGIYRPPNSNFAYMDLIKESVDRAYNTNIVDIFILGDFNYNMALNRENKITELMYEFNLSQLITDSTHFTEHSSSTIDLILARNTANILQSRVADPFIPDQIRYHCPIVVFLKFIRPSTKSFKRKIWNYKLADYDTYRTLLSESNLIENLQTDNDIDSNVKLVSSAILTSAESAIPNKIITVKASDLPWVTCRLKHLIRKRKRTFRQY